MTKQYNRLCKPSQLNKLKLEVNSKTDRDQTVQHDEEIESTIQAWTTKQAYIRGQFKNLPLTKQSNMTKQCKRLCKPRRLNKLTLEVSSKTDR